MHRVSDFACIMNFCTLFDTICHHESSSHMTSGNKGGSDPSSLNLSGDNSNNNKKNIGFGNFTREAYGLFLLINASIYLRLKLS